MSLDLGTKQQTYGVDIRDTAIHWINDIEKVRENKKNYKIKSVFLK